MKLRIRTMVQVRQLLILGELIKEEKRKKK